MDGILVGTKWSAQSCLTVSDPMDCSPPGSSVHEVFQSRILEWVAISFSRNWTQGLNPGLPHFRQMLYWLNHQGSLVGTGTGYKWWYLIYMMVKKVYVCESLVCMGIYICLDFMCVCVHMHWSYEMREKHPYKWNLCPLGSLANHVFRTCL